MTARPPDPDNAERRPQQEAPSDEALRAVEAQGQHTPDDVAADEHAARVLRTIGREVGMHHVSEGLAEIVADWLGGAA